MPGRTVPNRCERDIGGKLRGVSSGHVQGFCRGCHVAMSGLRCVYSGVCEDGLWRFQRGEL